MFVIYLENYEQSLRGKLKTYLYEIKPALYVGTVAAQTRDLIWTTMIETEKTLNAVLIYPDKNEQKFSVRIHGETKRKIEDFGGLWTVAHGEMLNINMLKSKQSIKPLICHFYETACVANCLMDGYLKNLILRISDVVNEDVRNLKNIILFFAFLHDVGKIHPAFQFKLIPDVLEDFGYQNNEVLYGGFRHEVYSEKVLSEYIDSRFSKLHSRNLVKIMPKAIKCHHQGKEPNSCPIPQEHLDAWTQMQKAVIEIANNLFPFTPSNSILKEYGNGIFELIIGIINLADWIASTQNVFDDKSPDNFNDVNQYTDYLKDQCMSFLKRNYMLGDSLNNMFHNPNDWWKLLIGKFSPRPMQKTVESLIDKHSQPSLLFVEDSCGGGKTEAAMYYALSQAKNAGGIYFALPTTATSENMRQRIASICANGIDSNFRVPVYNSMAWMQEDDVKLDSNLWQNDSKLKLFYPIAVGTVDQLLMSVQGIKYSDLGLIALSNKVLIIDEMHAYDAYMLEELKTLFSYCSLMGVTIIVLSATMTNETKKQLIVAYNMAKDRNNVEINGLVTNYESLQLSFDYPLITKVTKNAIVETASQISKSTTYEYKLLEVNQSTMFDNILNQAFNLTQDGGTVAVVFNTVALAIGMYSYTIAKCNTAGVDIDVDLLHSRFSLEEKDNKIKKILNKYGKDRSQRPKRSILISTQIIEQSLDVDFDYMITELAPIDLIEQRFGRVRRHEDVGTIREKNKLNGPSVFIFHEHDFGKSTYVYEKSILSATLDYLKLNNVLRSPVDVRDSIERVYLPSNINQLKTIRQEQQADMVLIGKVDCREFWRLANLSALRNDPHTRLETIPTTNIILVNDEQRKKIEIGEELQSRELKHIIKTQMYSSVPIKKIVGIDRVKTNQTILDEYYVFSRDQFNVSSVFGLQI